MALGNDLLEEIKDGINEKVSCYFVTMLCSD